MAQQIVTAPMASSVVEVLVTAGARVQAGQTLVIVEAMKMEHELRASAAGRVVAVSARAGEAVEAGDTLVTLAPADASDHAAERQDADSGEGPASDTARRSA